MPVGKEILRLFLAVPFLQLLLADILYSMPLATVPRLKVSLCLAICKIQTSRPTNIDRMIMVALATKRRAYKETLAATGEVAADVTMLRIPLWKSI